MTDKKHIGSKQTSRRKNFSGQNRNKAKKVANLTDNFENIRYATTEGHMSDEISKQAIQQLERKFS